MMTLLPSGPQESGAPESAEAAGGRSAEPTPSASLPTTSIVIPTLNEAKSIAAVLVSLREPSEDFIAEMIVCDGGSTDGTEAVVSAAIERDPRIRLIRNPKRLQSAGVNEGVRHASPGSRVILRADAHARYLSGFARRAVEALVDSGADSVVVRLRSAGESCFQRAVATVSNSWAGSGGAGHRSGGRSGFVDHGHHAAFRRQLFEDLGGYDEDLAVNEDAEFDARIRGSGGHIWFAADLEVVYLPRRSPAALATQYLRYGSGRARTFLKHRERLRLRQVLPPAALLGVLGGLALAPVWPALLVAPAGYAALLLALGAFFAIRDRTACAIGTPLALALMHLCWGAGFLAVVATGGLGRGVAGGS